MAAPVKPEPIPVPSPAPTPSSPPPVATQPTPSPAPAPVPSTNGAELERMRATLAAQDAVIRDNARELQRLRSAPPAPAPAAKDPKEFFNSPHEETAKIVQAELKKTIEPLQLMMQQMISRTTGVDALAGYRTRYPQFNWDKLAPQVTALAEAASNRGVTIDAGVMDTLALSAMGLAASGQIPDAMAVTTQAPVPPQLPVPVLTPPHLQPSAMPAPAPQLNGIETVKPLSENEARLARERGWTPEQYRSWENVSPDQVVNHKMPGEK